MEEALTLDNAKRWVANLMGRGLGVAVNGTRYLRSFASWLADSRYLVGPSDDSVLARLAPPRGTLGKRQPLTSAQLDEVWTAVALRSAADRARATAYLRLLRATGMRKDNARTLLRSDLHLNKSGSGGWVTVTWRGKRRRSELDRETATALNDYMSKWRPLYSGRVREPVFLTREGKPFTEWGFANWADRIWKDIERLTPSGIQSSSDYLRYTWKQEAAEPIRDAILRRRCEKFLRAVDDHDQAVREACLVLEDRVRKRSGGKADQIGTSLIEWAFSASSPRLRLADHDGERRGAMELFRGVTAFYRNGTSHRVRDDFDPTEALRVVALVDHLLWLIDERAVAVSP